MQKFLESSTYIDWQTPQVKEKALALTSRFSNELDAARACFYFVRDNICHSWDHKMNPVTLKASDVLKHGTGFCFAKSHLLAALLRANNIPAGLCYQRLTLANNQPPYTLHGLNAVYLKDYGWYRVDPRGNKPGVQAEFSPPVEQLAFTTDLEGEMDLPGILAEPISEVVSALEASDNIEDIIVNLPDIN